MPSQLALKGKLIRNNVPWLKGEVRRRVLKAVNRMAYQVASIAWQLCPVDTGYLRSTIAVETYRGGELLQVVVGANYAVYVEYGTAFSEAQPFLRPAAESVKDALGRELRAIHTGLEGLPVSRVSFRR